MSDLTRGRRRTLASSLGMALLFAAALNGCSLTGRPTPPPMATYVLSEMPDTAPGVSSGANSAPGAILRVSTPTVAPAFGSSRMAYVEQPYRVDYFAQNQWADTPPRMLKTLLRTYLAGCGLFRFVHADDGGVDDRLRLDSDIVELVQVFSETSSEVRVTIRFDLIDVSRHAFILSETISATEATTARDPYAGVVAANRAVQRVLEQLTRLLRVPVSSLDNSG